MHIAYLTPEYPHPKLGNSGGMGTSIKNLVTALVDQGHQVSLFVYGQKADEVFSENGVTFHLIRHIKYRFGGFYFYRKYIQRYLNKHLQEIDLIEAPDWTGITAFMNIRKPLVIRFHGSDTYFCHIEGRPQKKKNAFFEKQAVKNATAFIAPTTFAGTESMRLFNQPIEKLEVIHYGLELENFVNERPENFESKRLLNIGTLIRKKGVFQLIEMFNKLIKIHPDAQLYFIGADSYDVYTGKSSTWELMQEQMTPEAKTSIFYLGKIPYAEVKNEIIKAHVCVFPSLAETLGMVTIESMALQKAVVNTNIGWAQDLIAHGVDGFMHHPDDIDAYVNSIDLLFNDVEKSKRLGQQARKSVEQKFDINKLVHKNIAFYKRILTI
ncbi:glycosyltransferase family 1 protein [Dokdonia sinensis]|uniref:Glycosyltransferase family 1 protein n=1 Tax=Dokdonia sinensis TaxID=2479847 RepID=A0A3M0FXD9_9FLAO|nr:glycosyltransferase family 4 protein [Dokdonia sinensis]RMB57410.1 glycosyltransferase family 1 protein [Dokdonia sinensis]